MNNKRYSEEVIEAFLISKSRKEIVEKTGLSARTISRYSQDKEFQDILNERKTEYIKASVNKMQSVMSDCVDTLHEIITSEETTPTAKVSAINCLFNHCRDWTMTVDVLERIKNLEMAQNGSE